jgi:hypothetical protein
MADQAKHHNTPKAKGALPPARIAELDEHAQKCCRAACDLTTADPEADGWTYIWTSGTDPRIGWLKEGYYCSRHANEIDSRVRQAMEGQVAGACRFPADAWIPPG